MSKTLLQHHIVIEPRSLKGSESARYENEVSYLIYKMTRYKTGRLLLYWIKNCGTGLWALIAPYGKHWEDELGVCNAAATQEERSYAVTEQGAFYHPSYHQLVRVGSKVNFSIETWRGNCSIGPGFLPDEVLLHELVHAQRQVSRLSRYRPLTGLLTDFHTEEEFFAILIANVYISEAGRTDEFLFQTRLRMDHGQLPMPTWFSDPTVFLANPDYYALVQKYCRQHPKLSRGLADVSAKFNPFRAYYRWQTTNTEATSSRRPMKYGGYSATRMV